MRRKEKTMTAVDVHHHKVGGDKPMLGTDYPYTLGDWLGGENIHALKCSVAEKEANLEAMLGGC